MALNWKWSEKCGELTVRQTFNGETNEYVKTLYEGNAFLIMLNEWRDKKSNEDMYSMFCFFVDEAHAKRSLGFTGNGNIFNSEDYVVTKIRLNKAKSRNWKKIVTLFSRAFDNITIELYTGKEGDNDNNNS